MTVPNTGEISLGKIRQELESTSTSNDYNEGPYTGSTSLSGSETGVYDTINSGSVDRPDGVGPFKMSEWRGYGHNIAWYLNWGANIKNNFVLSGSRSQANTAPNNTVADQQVVSFTITNPSADAPTPPAGVTWDNASAEVRTDYVYVYISDDHANGLAGPYVDSGSVSIAMGVGQDPGVTGTGAGAFGYSKVNGTGWILTERKAGTNKSSATFLDHDGSAPANDPPFMLNVARIYVNSSAFQSSSFYVRMAYSGSGDNTYGFTHTPDLYGVPGTYHSRSIHVINGPYSSSFDFKTTIVS